MITGAAGMVAADLTEAISDGGEELFPVKRGELDITDAAAVARYVENIRPSVIINCAAFTRVDDAETHEAAAMAINGQAVRNLAAAADAVDALLVQISTDFVFDGTAREPYDVSAQTNPLSAYGRTKLVGEQEALACHRHLIVRTSWLFGTHGNNFVEAIRRQIDSGKSSLKVVDDQQGKPTYTPHLAEALIALSRNALEAHSKGGVCHYADDSEASWFDFAKAIVDELKSRGRLQQDVIIQPVSTAEFQRPAVRPQYSVLSTSSYVERTGKTPRSWRRGLEEYFRA